MSISTIKASKEAMRREAEALTAAYKGNVTRCHTAVANGGNAGVDNRGFAQCKLSRQGK